MSVRLLMCLWLSLATVAFGQYFARPNMVMNMKWGAPRQEVLKTIADAGATVPPALYDSTEPEVHCTGGMFAGQEVVSWDIEFVNGRLASFAATLKAVDSGSALYRDVKKELLRKYGPSSGERKFTPTLDTPRRAAQLAASRNANQGTATFWKFPPNLQEKDALTLTCEMAPPPRGAVDDEDQFLVTLRYTCESMKTQLSASTDTAAESKTGRTLLPKDL